MENLSPSRIQPLLPDEQKSPDDPRPKKQQPKVVVVASRAIPLPALDDGDSNDLPPHKLDERA